MQMVFLAKHILMIVQFLISLSLKQCKSFKSSAKHMEYSFLRVLPFLLPIFFTAVLSLNDSVTCF